MVTLDNSKALIVGLGKTGLSCARYLSAHGVPAAITDSRESPPGLAELRNEVPDMALFLGRFDAEVFDAAEQLVVSPGVSLKEPLIQKSLARGVPIIGDIELFARSVNVPVVAITGSNGKSTVTTLVGEMLEAAGHTVAVGGNLGEPALNLLQPSVDVYVLELSSFQLETTQSLKPEVAVVLNISADHMDRYEDIDDYCQTKETIYQQARHSLINLDDTKVVAMAEGTENNIHFTLGAPEAGVFGIRQVEGSAWLSYGDQPLMAIAELQIPGLHNVANALAALAIGQCLKVGTATMLSCLRQFTGLPHRMQLVADVNDVRWYNDSKGTNVGACIAALEGFALEPESQKTVLIAGGDGKGADFNPLKAAVTSGVRAVVLIGQDAGAIAAVLDASTDLTFAQNMSQAIAIAERKASRGDRVLFSPACASFDMYRNYQERGDAFVDSVRRAVQ